MKTAQHTPGQFRLLHSVAIPLRRIIDHLDESNSHGAMMDAPELLHIGCTSKRQDLVNRGFDAEVAFIETCLLHGFGKRASMTPFEYECMFNRAAIAKARGES